MKINEEIILEAIDLARPSIFEIASTSSKAKQGVSIVVFSGKIEENNGENTKEAEVMIDRKIGASDQKYSDMATRKARLSWRLGANSRSITKGFYTPILLEGEDCIYGGSYEITIGNIRLVVATSALKEHEDEAISMIVAATIVMLLHRKLESTHDGDGIVQA